MVHFLLTKRLEQSGKLGWVFHELVNFMANQFNPRNTVVCVNTYFM